MAGDWTDSEITTFRRREQRLKQEGLSDVEAEKLAERLLYRDRPGSGDDRRICLECKNLTRRGPCSVVLSVQAPELRTTLMRCDAFAPVRVNKAVETIASNTQGMK